MTFLSESNFLENGDIDKNVISENIKAPLLPKDDNELKNVENATVETAEDINKSETANENLTIPVFSEWTQQQIQEAENKLTNSTEPNKDIKNETLAKHQVVKMRQKNYASPDCGAKVLASNPEAQSISSVLTDKDEYLLSPCTDRIWFVVELCDSIQAQRVELANFELFSSPLKSVSISVSNRYPTREWTFAGHFDAKSARDVQVLELSSLLFGKFVRVDLTYTNTEHYCPLSFFRIFGTSEIEAFEVENEPSSEFKNPIDDDDDYDHQLKDKVQQPNNNLLNRAGAAVMSIVNKAAEVLAKSNDNGRKLNETSDKIFESNCVTLSHNILCQHCSTHERTELDNLISCKNAALSSLLSSDDDIRSYLANSVTCQNVLGFKLKSDKSETGNNFIMSILPQKYVSALCNLVATDQKSLGLRSEDIPGIHSNLISKKDEVSLKNISKKETPVEDPLCNQDFYATTTESPALNLATDEKIVKENSPAVASGNNSNNNSLSGDELNIFNVVEQQKQEDASSSTDSVVVSTTETPYLKTEEASKDEKAPEEIVKPETNYDFILDPSQAPTTVPPDSSEVTDSPSETKHIEQAEFKASQPSEQAEPKTNGDYRSSNHPESVFLRLSNRIKTLEKNMTLSTQYLEELSRRYKKQIEDLQHSFVKLQSVVDEQSSKKRESDKKDGEYKKRLHENVENLNQKFEYLEVILITLSTFFMVQTILVIALFRRISNLRQSYATHQQQQETAQAASICPSICKNENGRSTGRKRSKQRTRKISAPNILTQRSPSKNEFSQTSPILSRTVSAPNKFNGLTSMTENKENYDEMKAMLEENDDVLIPGFEDLKLNDDDESIKSNDIETASTASAVSSNEKHEQSSSNKSFKFKRRFSFQTKKPSMKNSSSDRSNQIWEKKAMSESPPRNLNENSIEIHKSKSFHEDDEGSVKFKKSNSFKKLFKKLF